MKKQPVVDLLDDPQIVQMGLWDGSLFVDLSRKSGLWAVRDRDVLKKFAPTQLGGLSGIAIGPDPVHIRLASHDVAGRCVKVLAVAGTDDTSLKVARTGTKGVKADLGAEPELVELQCFEPDFGDDVDVRVSSSPGALLAGIWLSAPDSEPFAAAVPLTSCGQGRGVALEPGASLSAAVLLAPSQTLELSATGEATSISSVQAKITLDAKAEPTALELVGADPGSASWINESDQPVATLVTTTMAPNVAERVCVQLLTPKKKVSGAVRRDDGDTEVVIVVMTDTMRGDLYASEGSESFGVPMPTLEKLAARSTVFSGATAHASYTKPSVGTILTGLYPEQHGGLSRKGPVSDKVPLISQMLADEQVTTVAFMSNFFFNPTFGLRRGWTDEQFIDPWGAAMDDQIVLDRFETWAEAGVPEGKLFIYIHLMGAHAPYTPPKNLREEFLAGESLFKRIVPKHTAQLIKDLTSGRSKRLNKRETAQIQALYRADAAYHDGIIKKLLATLDSSGLLDRALLIYTSDHGEEFYEHGRIGHGTGLWYEQIRVPLWVHEPRQTRSEKIGTTVGHVDVVPTILAAFGVDPPAGLPGRDLLATSNEPDRVDRGLLMQNWMGRWGVQVGPYKLLRRPADEKIFALDGASEKELSLAEATVLHQVLRRAMALLYVDLGEPTVGSGEQDGSFEIDPALADQLEKLGYMLND